MMAAVDENIQSESVGFLQLYKLFILKIEEQSLQNSYVNKCK